ncbi:MAG: lytic transglycosylase domain-containing protein, partial [Patescibacteria group bacterium]|nr:lytic transglycosylase domain-containing protein [Patescibacteria group bacterium]
MLLAIFYFFFPHVWGELLYPLDYKDSIKKYSEERGLRPNFVCAIIYTESRFNPKSVSSVGALGLMQVMPGTGDSIAQEIGEKTGDLTDPDTSIKYGTWYIKGLVDKYKDGVMALPNETTFFVQKVKSAEAMYDKVYDAWYSQS